MTRRTEEFAVGDAATLSVRLASADVRVVEGVAQAVTVVIDGRDPDRFTVEQHGNRVVVEQPAGVLRWGGYDVTITAPAGIALEVQLASADLDCDVPVRALRGDAASGDLRARDIAGDAAIRTASGGVRLGDVAGDLEVSSASGSVRAGVVTGSAHINTASGDCMLAGVGSTLEVRTASGNVAVSRYDGSDAKARSMSGDIRVGFPAGRTLDVDMSTLSGDVRSTFDVAPDRSSGSRNSAGEVARVQLQTVSGDITIGPA